MPVVADVMKSDPLVFTGSETMEAAIREFAQRQIGAAPIVIDGKLAGMVTETALLDVVFDPQLRTAPVSEAADGEFRAVDAASPLGRAAHQFGLTAVDCLPVVDGESFVGMLLRRDVLACALDAGDTPWNPLAEMTGYAPTPTS
ncbi:MAG: hypothetical protein CMJ58_10640 [Planctomycetaceae bacterium]|nr:hypothetical protein [Planctomycetaceae bacterium]